ncbi:hypothetical protein [Flammeovirga kamogawensis]|uniref:hypothetical protein n=1 Tax=Flammeovirga kamogawensis TaxID=373891 RepID=UPI0017B486D4|nr:hypothetical protein [Flammeovirga kamogawensis]MBB6461827.1 hypothetical protein [Flammeovirga kamogawensis]
MKLKNIILGLLFLCSFSSFAQVIEYDSAGNRIPRKEQFSRSIPNVTFVPKGQWLVGSTFMYSEHKNDNYQFLIMKDWDGKGYNLAVSPFFAYFIKDNFAVGGRFTYKRSGLDIDQLNITLTDDLKFSINGAHQISQTFYTTAFMRNYISLGHSKRFGLFNEARISYGYGQSKETVVGENAEDTKGVYSETHEFNIGVAPGMVAFINDMVALEVSIGVLGFTNKWVKQTENQVESGSRSVNNANFKIDIFSLNIGLAFYL